MTTIQLIADLLIGVGAALIWAALHIVLGNGLFLPLTYTEIREGNFLDVEDSTINDSSSATSRYADSLQGRHGG